MATNNSWNNQVLDANVTFNGGTMDIGTDATDNAIDIGTSASAGRTITIGNTTGTSGIVLDAGTDEIVASADIQAPGISFDSGVNVLNFYEQGTWTPTLQFGGGTTGITYGVQVGEYTRIGDLVYIQFRIVLTNKGSSTGAATITALPYSGGISLRTSGAIRHSLITFSQDYLIMTVGTTTISIIEQGSTTVGTALTDTAFANTSEVRGCMTYRT